MCFSEPPEPAGPPPNLQMLWDSAKNLIIFQGAVLVNFILANPFNHFVSPSIFTAFLPFSSFHTLRVLTLDGAIGHLFVIIAAVVTLEENVFQLHFHRVLAKPVRKFALTLEHKTLISNPEIVQLYGAI